MHIRRARVVPATALVVLSLLALTLLPAGADAAPSPQGAAHSHAPVCPGPHAPDTARCHAQKRTDAVGTPAQQSVAQLGTLGNNGAYDPGWLQAAYNLAGASGGAGATVAIVDAYDDPYAASDLSAYRSHFNLPSCTTSTGCFRKVTQSGQTRGYPAFDSGWAQEIALDLDMVSAICPRCKILLVEAQSSSYADLGTAVDYAAKVSGVVAISNSYGGGESSGETSYEGHYNHPGKAITVSSGDSGYGVEFPAASRYVTAVGGTTLNQLSNTGGRNATEAVWSGAGSGCSAYIPKPSWQTDQGCATRTVADVAAVADPNTGVWVYYNRGWYIFGGTSVASPIIASVYALAGNAATVTAGAYLYSHTGSLNDVTAGSNGTCSGSYLCTGTGGYDGPTGNGTPNGTGGF